MDFLPVNYQYLLNPLSGRESGVLAEGGLT